MDLNKTGNEVKKLVTGVASFIKNERKNFSLSKVEHKGYHDLVSYVDRTAEQMLVDGLKQILPDSGFITEENTASHTIEEYIWIIDPLDGTTNFVHNLTPHAISVGLRKGDEMILGIIYEIGADEIFYSWKGIPVFCNNTQVTVSNAKSIDSGLIATGFSINDFSRLEKHLKTIDTIIKKSHGIRRHGSAATDLAYIAAGRFDGFFEYALSVWDVAAGAFLVQQAGGTVTDYSGGNNFFIGREIIAASPSVHSDLLKIIKETM